MSKKNILKNLFVKNKKNSSFTLKNFTNKINNFYSDFQENRKKEKIKYEKKKKLEQKRYELKQKCLSKMRRAS